MGSHYYRHNFRRRRSHSFAIIVTALFFIALAVIWTVLSQLWNYLEAYEKHNPDSAVQEYISIYRNRDFDGIAKACGFEYSHFNDEEAFEKHMTDSFGGDFSNVKATRIAGGGETLRYNLKNGDKLLTVITVSPNGKLDSYGMEGWEISERAFDGAGKHSARVCVPSGVSAFVDGKKIPSEFLTDASFSVNDYDDLDDESLRPSFQTYEVKGLLNEPKIAAAGADGAEFSLIESEETHYAFPLPDEALLAEIKSRAEEIAVQYSHYAIQDIKFSELEPFLVKESKYARTIKDFSNEWYIQREFTYDNVAFGDIIQYDSSHAVVNISFSYHIKLTYKTKDYNARYKMSLLKQNGEWLLAGMKIS